MLFSCRYKKVSVASGNGGRITVGIADTWIKRFKGFKKKGLSNDVDGLLIYPCSSIHTIGMTFTIDVYFLDESFRLMRSCFGVGPRRFIFVPGAKYVLELKTEGFDSPFATIGEYLNFE